jgi:hypothetical protein
LFADEEATAEAVEGTRFEAAAFAAANECDRAVTMPIPRTTRLAATANPATMADF